MNISLYDYYTFKLIGNIYMYTYFFIRIDIFHGAIVKSICTATASTKNGHVDSVSLVKLSSKSIDGKPKKIAKIKMHASPEDSCFLCGFFVSHLKYSMCDTNKKNIYKFLIYLAFPRHKRVAFCCHNLLH